ncbi:hypothetical protein BT67DRAFT_455810, partial [Trichocladium antarcticum]
MPHLAGSKVLAPTVSPSHSTSSSHAKPCSSETSGLILMAAHGAKMGQDEIRDRQAFWTTLSAEWKLRVGACGVEWND